MSEDQLDYTANELQMIEGDHSEGKPAPTPPVASEVTTLGAGVLSVDTVLADEPKLVKRPLDADMKRMMEVLLRRRDQVLTMAAVITGLDGVDVDNGTEIVTWLRQDFGALITALEFMPEPKTA